MFDLSSWTISYLANTAFFIAAMVSFWTGVRDYILKRNFRKFLFGTGLLFLSFGYLVISLYNNLVLPPYIVIFFVIGFNLILASLIRKKIEYIFFSLNILPILISLNQKSIIFFSVIPLVISWMSYKNYCHRSCDKNECKKIMAKSNEWSLFFLLMTFDILFTTFLITGYGEIEKQILIYATIALEMFMAAIVYYHILRCNNYGSKEKIAIPLLMGFLMLASFGGFYINQKFQTFIEEELGNETLKETRAAILIAKSVVAPEKIEDMVLKEERTLNDVADQVLLETGIRMTFFKGNERIAAAMSASGSGRMLGSKLNDPEINKKIFDQAEPITIRVFKGGQYSMASYVPLIKDNTVIGMIGSGLFLTDFHEMQTKLLLGSMVALVVVGAGVFIVIGYNFPKEIKILRKRKK